MATRRGLLQGTGIAVLALAAGGCSNWGASSGEDLNGSTAVLSLPWEDTPHTADAARASARIAWQVVVSHQDIRTSNIAMSPSSLAVTLAMLAEGAKGDSLASLDEAFGLTGDGRSAAIGALRQALSGYEDLPKRVDADAPPETPVVHQANRTVILSDAEINANFLDRLSSYYDSGTTRVPFSEAEANLDAWAKEHTAGLIERSSIDLVPGIGFVAQDALLFAARWRQAFSSENAPLSFTNANGSTGDLEALKDVFSTPYARAERWEAVRLAYDDVLAMDVVLPRLGTHPSELDFATVEESSGTLGRVGDTAVQLTMPPSDITTGWDLLEPLGRNGIPLSDLGGIFDGASTDQMAQQARLIVTAKGTVGAAVTEGAAVVSAPVIDVDLVVDRPFIMRVLDVRTGWPLFLAIVNDPGDPRR